MRTLTDTEMSKISGGHFDLDLSDISLNLDFSSYGSWESADSEAESEPAAVPETPVEVPPVETGKAYTENSDGINYHPITYGDDKVEAVSGYDENGRKIVTYQHPDNSKVKVVIRIESNDPVPPRVYAESVQELLDLAKREYDKEHAKVEAEGGDLSKVEVAAWVYDGERYKGEKNHTSTSTHNDTDNTKYADTRGLDVWIINPTKEAEIREGVRGDLGEKAAEEAIDIMARQRIAEYVADVFSNGTYSRVTLYHPTVDEDDDGVGDGVVLEDHPDIDIHVHVDMKNTATRGGDIVPKGQELPKGTIRVYNVVDTTTEVDPITNEPINKPEDAYWKEDVSKREYADNVVFYYLPICFPVTYIRCYNSGFGGGYNDSGENDYLHDTSRSCYTYTSYVCYSIYIGWGYKPETTPDPTPDPGPDPGPDPDPDPDPDPGPDVRPCPTCQLQ